MPKIEYFLQKINSWVVLPFPDYISLLFPNNQDDQEKKSFSKIKSIKNLPMSIISDEDNSTLPPVDLDLNLISGNYVEISQNFELSLIPDKKKGSLTVANNNQLTNKSIKSSYEIWSRAKIVSADLENQIFFLENFDEQIIVIDDLKKIRPLKQEKNNNNNLDDFDIYFLTKISTSEYNFFKKQFDNLSDELKKNNNDNLLFQKYDPMNNSLQCLMKSNFSQKFSSLKDFEERYSSNADLSNSNSEVNSNKNSSRNVPGVTSRSGKSEESEDKNGNTDIEYARYKQKFIYNIKFKNDMEKILGNEIKKNKFFIGKKNNEEDFSVTIYGDIETDFNEEKKMIEKNFKKAEINVEGNVAKNTVKELANKAKIKLFYYDKKSIYLVGEDKSIKIFKSLLGMNLKYSKEIQKNENESEDMKKELVKFKKENKIK